jgi:Uma2 family endonuclease
VCGATVLIEGDVEIPGDIASLEDFRQWALSDKFPERGRFDYIRGVIEVDLTPQRHALHAAVKPAVLNRLSERVLGTDLGNVYFDQTRVSSPPADLSAAPDGVVLCHKTIERGSVRLVPAEIGSRAFVEIEGGPDLVVEIVSPTSITRDLERLPSAYFDAGVREYWLVDARKDAFVFQIFRRGERAFEQAAVDSEMYQHSDLLGCRYRLERTRRRHEEWRYDLRGIPDA